MLPHEFTIEDIINSIANTLKDLLDHSTIFHKACSKSSLFTDCTKSFAWFNQRFNFLNPNITTGFCFTIDITGKFTCSIFTDGIHFTDKFTFNKFLTKELSNTFCSTDTKLYATFSKSTSNITHSIRF